MKLIKCILLIAGSLVASSAVAGMHCRAVKNHPGSSRPACRPGERAIPLIVPDKHNCCKFTRDEIALLGDESKDDSEYSPSQTKREFASELAKFAKLTHGKTVKCKRTNDSSLTPYDDKDYGDFTLKVKGATLAFTGNPGDKDGVTELNVGEFTIVHFGGSTGSTRYLAVIDYAGNLGLGSTSGNLIQMDEGQLTRLTPIDCQLGD